MTAERQLPAPRRRLEYVERQEEQTWARFYPQARSDATLAQEILAELERDELLRRRHRALYLSCQRCVRLHDLRQARHQHVGRVVRAAARGLFVTAPQALYRGLRQAGLLVMACLPQDDAQEPLEPLQAQARRLLERDAYAQGGQTLRARAQKARKAADKVASQDESEHRSNDQDSRERLREPASAKATRASPAMAKSAVG